MRVLLDTNALLWSLVLPEKLSRIAAEIISKTDHEILVSAASAWEIATKVRSGKLRIAETLEKNFVDIMRQAGYDLIDIRPQDALRAGRMPGNHRDPFDRMIAAQALALDIPVISIDSKLDAFGVRRIW